LIRIDKEIIILFVEIIIILVGFSSNESVATNLKDKSGKSWNHHSCASNRFLLEQAGVARLLVSTTTIPTSSGLLLLVLVVRVSGLVTTTR